MDLFQEKFKEASFEDDIYVTPVCIEEVQDDLHTKFNICLQNNEIVQEWRVVCTDLADYNLTLEFVEDINVCTDHVLLWGENQEQCQLFFSRKPSSLYEVIGALYAKHQAITQGWIEFDTFFNELSSLETLLAEGYGLLGEGPEELFKSYKEVLDNYGISTSLLPKKRHSQECPYQVMVFSKSYVIARHFSFDLLSDKNTINRPK